jgi:hypothetical protein
MTKFDIRKNWWIVPVVVGVLAVAAFVIIDRLFPSLGWLSAIIVLGLLGASFLWVYFTDRKGLWWAIIPALGLFTLLAAVLVDLLTGTETSNDWINVLVIGAGAALMAWVLKRKNARTTMIIVAIITIFVGILMAPLSILWKCILVAVDILVGGYCLWLARKG